MKLENIGDITLMTNEDGREFYVPGHVEGRLILQATEQHEKDVAPRAILTGTQKEMNMAGVFLYNGDVTIVPTERLEQLLEMERLLDDFIEVFRLHISLTSVLTQQMTKILKVKTKGGH